MIRTSRDCPIRVDWVLPNLGVTFAPGKSAESVHGADWRRDLDLDLRRLRHVHKVDVLVSLIEPREAEQLNIPLPRLASRAAAAGLKLLVAPIRDVSTPASAKVVRRLLARIAQFERAGARVVIFCRGGLGRSGTIAGCYLRFLELPPDEVEAMLRAGRGDNCPETPAQREYIRAFQLDAAAPG